MEPAKPFACTIPDCGMSFTNEDHLHVHTKKHDMVLQLGMEQKAAFAADQTPTPTRFIRNCEEVGLFQDLQNVNPFDEGFKRAMEAKHGVLSLETSSEDVLHTPHLIFPVDADCTMYTANNQRNITISRSSSDESGAVKEYETTTISKLTNEVTTISRVVKPEQETKLDKKDVETVSYTNNVIKIQEIRTDGVVNIENKEDGKKNEIKKVTEGKKEMVTFSKPKLPPMMSQQSLDHVIDLFSNEGTPARINKSDGSDQRQKSEEKSDGRQKSDDKSDRRHKSVEKDVDEDIEVVVKLPNGKRVKMKAVEEVQNAKEKLRDVIKNKERSILNHPKPLVPCGTLIPVTLVKTLPVIQQVPLSTINQTINQSTNQPKVRESVSDKVRSDNLFSKRDSASAASKRYRERLKLKKSKQEAIIQRLDEENLLLKADVDLLEKLISRHIKKCSNADELRQVWEERQRLKKPLNR